MRTTRSLWKCFLLGQAWGSWRAHKTFSCDPHRVLAKKLEPLVLEKVQSYICNDNFALELLKRAQNRFEDQKKNNEARKIKARIQAVDGQLDALAERLSTIPTNISAVPIFNQMEILQNRKSELKTAYLVPQEGFYPRDTPIEFESLKKLTSGLERLLNDESKPELKAKIIKKLVSKIEIGTESVKIHFLVGKKELNNLDPKIKNPEKIRGFIKNEHFGSNSLTNGAPGRT